MRNQITSVSQCPHNRLTKLWGNSSFFFIFFLCLILLFCTHKKKRSLYKSWRKEDKVCPRFSEEKWEGRKVSLIWRSRACHLRLKYSLEKQKQKTKNWRHLHSLRGRQRWPFQKKFLHSSVQKRGEAATLLPTPGHLPCVDTCCRTRKAEIRLWIKSQHLQHCTLNSSISGPLRLYLWRPVIFWRQSNESKDFAQLASFRVSTEGRFSAKHVCKDTAVDSG